MSNSVAKTAKFQVKRSELPICCPRKDEEVWDKHPRVFLDLSKTGEATCPYCSAHYELVD